MPLESGTAHGRRRPVYQKGLGGHARRDVAQERNYNHPEVERIWHGAYKEYLVVLSRIIFYLLQDGCKLEHFSI